VNVRGARGREKVLRLKQRLEGLGSRSQQKRWPLKNNLSLRTPLSTEKVLELPGSIHIKTGEKKDMTKNNAIRDQLSLYKRNEAAEGRINS